MRADSAGKELGLGCVPQLQQVGVLLGLQLLASKDKDLRLIPLFSPALIFWCYF